MARFNVTPEDFLKGELADPGWHPAVIKNYEEKITQRKPTSPPDWTPSMYIEIQFKITAGKCKGQVKYQNYSEKAPSFMVPLLEAFGLKVNKKEGVEFEVSKEKLEGKTVDIHIIRGSFNNKPKDEIDGYKPYTGPALTGEVETPV